MRRYLAANRFGLGVRIDATAPDDPERALLSEIARFEEAPAAIANLPPRGDLANAVLEYREQQAQQRQERTAQGAPGEAADAAAQEQMRRRQRQRGAMAADRRTGRATDGGADMQEEGARMGPLRGRQAGGEMPNQPPQNRMARRGLRMHYMNAVHARTATAIASTTPFMERWVHFWSNHFAVSVDKIAVAPFAGDYEFRAIRPHVRGRFANLLVAAVTHPAMLLFLDQAQSIGPDSPAGQRAAMRRPDRQSGLNENLAREILELHTLGVRSGYTQADVTQLANALTGITVAGLGRGAGQRLMQGAEAGTSVFVDALHQPGERTVLGRRYTQRGAGQAEAILADLAVHPATARHLATKIARHFVADTPPPALVARLEADFLRTGGDLTSLARTLVQSPEALDSSTLKFKSPWDWTLSAMRGLGLSLPPNPQATAAMFEQLGQTVWRPGSPAGFADTSSEWTGPQALSDRVDLADRLAQRAGAVADPRQLAQRLLADALSPEVATAIARADSPSQGLALLLVSPAFLRR